MIETTYGKKIIGTSQFVLVAPHAGGDDLMTEFIARRLARALNGFAVINTIYTKPGNPHARPGKIEDFNKLSWSQTLQKYLWFRPVRRKLGMRHFFRDLAECTALARTLSSDGKAVCIHIHGMKSDEYGFDLGAGITPEEEKKEKNTGTQTLEEKILIKIQQTLEEKILKDWNMKVSIGRFAGISRQSAIQFHTHDGHHDHAIQIEISSFFRNDKHKLRYCVQTLTDTLSQIF